MGFLDEHLPVHVLLAGEARAAIMEYERMGHHGFQMATSLSSACGMPSIVYIPFPRRQATLFVLRVISKDSP